jgi:hypothetical protein
MMMMKAQTAAIRQSGLQQQQRQQQQRQQQQAQVADRNKIFSRTTDK